MGKCGWQRWRKESGGNLRRKMCRMQDENRKRYQMLAVWKGLIKKLSLLIWEVCYLWRRIFWGWVHIFVLKVCLCQVRNLRLLERWGNKTSKFKIARILHGFWNGNCEEAMIKSKLVRSRGEFEAKRSQLLANDDAGGMNGRAKNYRLEESSGARIRTRADNVQCRKLEEVQQAIEGIIKTNMKQRAVTIKGMDIISLYYIYNSSTC